MRLLSTTIPINHNFEHPPRWWRETNALSATAIDADRFPILAAHWPFGLIVGGQLCCNDDSPLAQRFNTATNTWAADTNVGTQLVRVDVDPDGSPWFVDVDTFIGRFNNSTFEGIGVASLDIGVGADGSVFIVDSAGAIHQWNDAKTQFDAFDSKFSGVGRNIDVDPNGRPWVVNNVFVVYQYDGSDWIKRSGVKAQDIAIGANGSVFVAGTDEKPYKWNATSKIWDKVTNTADRVAVEPDGDLWIANTSDGKIYYAK